MYNVCVLIYVVKEKSKEQNPNPRKKNNTFMNFLSEVKLLIKKNHVN